MSEVVCQECGVLIEAKLTGRPRKHCEPCRKKTRKQYQHEQWLKHRSTMHKQHKSLVPNLLTVPSKLGNKTLLLDDLERYDHSRRARFERNKGGSGYSAFMPKNIDHSLYQCRLKLLKAEYIMLRFKLDFTMSQQRVLTEPMQGTDPWAWYEYEFNRRLRERRMRVSVE